LLKVKNRREEVIIINTVQIIIFDTQLDLLLKSLELYCYSVNEKYNGRKISNTKSENLEKSFVRDTYSQLLAYKHEAKSKIL